MIMRIFVLALFPPVGLSSCQKMTFRISVFFLFLAILWQRKELPEICWCENNQIFIRTFQIFAEVTRARRARRAKSGRPKSLQLEVGSPETDLQYSSVRCCDADNGWWQLSSFLQVAATTQPLYWPSTYQSCQWRYPPPPPAGCYWSTAYLVDSVFLQLLDASPVWETRGRTPPSTLSGRPTLLSLGPGPWRSGCSTLG